MIACVRAGLLAAGRAGAACPGCLLAPLAVRGRSCGLTIPPRRCGAFDRLLSGGLLLAAGLGFLLSRSRRAAFLLSFGIRCSFHFPFWLLLRALFCGLFTGRFWGHQPTPKTRRNRGGWGLRKEEEENGRKGRRGKGLGPFGRVLISSCQRGGKWTGAEPDRRERMFAARGHELQARAS